MKIVCNGAIKETIGNSFKEKYGKEHSTDCVIKGHLITMSL